LGKFVPVHTINAYTGSGDTAPLICNLMAVVGSEWSLYTLPPQKGAPTPFLLPIAYDAQRTPDQVLSGGFSHTKVIGTLLTTEWADRVADRSVKLLCSRLRISGAKPSYCRCLSLYTYRSMFIVTL